MTEIKWNLLKNRRLKETRGVSFEELIGKAELIAVKEHPKRELQSIMLFYYRNYVWVVHYVEDENGNIFLKTLYPSRKYTKKFKGEEL